MVEIVTEKVFSSFLGNEDQDDLDLEEAVSIRRILKKLSHSSKDRMESWKTKTRRPWKRFREEEEDGFINLMRLSQLCINFNIRLYKFLSKYTFLKQLIKAACTKNPTMFKKDWFFIFYWWLREFFQNFFC